MHTPRPRGCISGDTLSVVRNHESGIFTGFHSCYTAIGAYGWWDDPACLIRTKQCARAAALPLSLVIKIQHHERPMPALRAHLRPLLECSPYLNARHSFAGDAVPYEQIRAPMYSRWLALCGADLSDDTESGAPGFLGCIRSSAMPYRTASCMMGWLVTAELHIRSSGSNQQAYPICFDGCLLMPIHLLGWQPSDLAGAAGLARTCQMIYASVRFAGILEG
ncbi:hypothetical protein OBBRIDRAFT_93130 [Obba rivulosa]|uniref:Uncharacterized protein n=1 Tax=Obba rivulosa TaxID=1052685 RepID=A0A8E2AUI1_9APHY|nr:hypothetical protein OBBRIDRAFT_93130 [Obba rivulosa]